jgi:Ca2+-binding EF-hand superfamily protein
VDGLASALGKEYMGYHPTCRWNLEVTARRKNAAMERDESENAEMERTLQNLWRAWIGKYDADKSGTVSLAELKAFASAEVCPSSDSYMQTLHEWASNALELGDLDAEFNRVDVDGSGELEYPEFRAMLLTE